MRSSKEPAPDDQRAVIGFLSRPASYGSGIDHVDRIETHVSLIFLAGEHAYKLKRAVRLPYLDFSSAEQRRVACAAELALNRRTAPSLYSNLLRLGRDANGKIGFVDHGPALDWVVVMRRFDQDALFDVLARWGALDGALMDALADHIAEFHAKAEVHTNRGGIAALSDIAATNHQMLAAAPPAMLAPERIAALFERWRHALATVAPVIENRRIAGKVRRCHGDLHLRNICLVDGRPTLFDCLEFSEELASIDVLYDLAFLVMDLEYRQLPALAHRVLNRYLDRTADEDGLAAMPLFLSLRAGIRAQVAATALTVAAGGDNRPEMAEEVRRYLDLAHRLLDPQPRCLIAIGGLSGSGKSTLAGAIAPELGLRPGARVLRSDIIRKLALGADPETRLPVEAYTPEITQRVYDTLRARARTALLAGYTAIIDAVALRPAERQAFADLAREAGVPFTGLWLDADAQQMQGRLGARRNDASDATAEILAQQLRQDAGPMDWIRIDGRGSREEVLATARQALGAC